MKFTIKRVSSAVQQAISVIQEGDEHTILTLLLKPTLVKAYANTDKIKNLLPALLLLLS